MADELAIREQRNKDMEERVLEATQKKDELITARKLAGPKEAELERVASEIRVNQEKRAEMLEARVAAVGGVSPALVQREAKERELAALELRVKRGRQVVESLQRFAGGTG